MGITRGQWKLSPLSVEIGEETPAPARRTPGAFVTGTGTEIGKTVVAAALARTLANDGSRVAVFKPALTGMDEFPGYDETAAKGAESIVGLPDHAILRVAARSSQSDDEIAPYRFDPPMSPHLAAGLAGVEIDPDRVINAARSAAAGVDWIVCEGAGGLLVPLSPSWTMRSFAVELGYPLVVVSPPGLGSINHTLLTVEAARAVGLKIAAIVLNPWPAEPTAIEADNRETIANLSNVPVLTLPHLDLADLAGWPELRLPG
ncbi:MAG TPA: dethiobiotin synthase [Solirubrobacterales bacterium]|jgi:dethiobiotin synthetase|nr:dethiobiotin synthase [Solirubrobacterales bacterium]